MTENCNECNEIKCSNCGYLINKNGTLRCPRCFTLLIKPGCSGNCSKCNSMRITNK